MENVVNNGKWWKVVERKESKGLRTRIILEESQQGVFHKNKEVQR